jgi:hypothetical protein
MSSSVRKIAANRINGQKSHGPKNTTSTRLNATKHGLFAQGITELDDGEGYRTILSDLVREKKPVGALEMRLVESAALDMARWPRARRLEAECITAELNPPTYGPGLGDIFLSEDPVVIDPGLPAAISPKGVQQLVTLQRYESTFINRFFRTLHELERLQRMRQGERLPAPAVVDIGVHTQSGMADSQSQHPDSRLGTSDVEVELESSSTGAGESPIPG